MLGFLFSLTWGQLGAIGQAALVTAQHASAAERDIHAAERATSPQAPRREPVAVHSVVELTGTPDPAYNDFTKR